MRFGGNSFNYYFLDNESTKLANLIQLKRMLMFCLEDWGLGSLVPPCLTPLLSGDVSCRAV